MNPQHTVMNPQHTVMNPQHTVMNPQHTVMNPQFKFYYKILNLLLIILQKAYLGKTFIL